MVSLPEVLLQTIVLSHDLLPDLWLEVGPVGMQLELGLEEAVYASLRV